VSLDPEVSLPHALPQPPADGAPAAAQVTSWVESACAVVPARDYGAASGGAGTLYECGSRG
jgi:hypothetical protein